MKIQRMGMLVFVASVFVVPQVGAVTLEDLVNSSDVIMSEKAQGGAAVAVVEHPENFEGGIKLAGGQGITMQAIISQWKLDPVGGLGTLMRDAAQGNAPVAAGGLIQNGEFTTDLAGWTVANMSYGGASAYGGASSFGPIVAPAGSVDGRFAVVHTGTWDQSNHGSIEQGFRVNQATSATFTIGYNFITTEDNAAQFNDNGIINVYLNDGTGTVMFGAFDSKNSSTFTPVSGLPLVLNGGWGQNGFQTGWQTASSGTLFFNKNMDYSVRIEVNDVSDRVLDSAILVDMVGLQ